MLIIVNLNNIGYFEYFMSALGLNGAEWYPTDELNYTRHFFFQLENEVNISVC